MPAQKHAMHSQVNSATMEQERQSVLAARRAPCWLKQGRHCAHLLATMLIVKLNTDCLACLDRHALAVARGNVRNKDGSANWRMGGIFNVCYYRLVLKCVLDSHLFCFLCVFDSHLHIRWDMVRLGAPGLRAQVALTAPAPATNRCSDQRNGADHSADDCDRRGLASSCLAAAAFSVNYRR